MGCKGICQQFREPKPEDVGMYQVGIKRCTICNVNMKLGQLRCPCCNSLLRTKPREGRAKNEIPRGKLKAKYF